MSMEGVEASFSVFGSLFSSCLGPGLPDHEGLCVRPHNWGVTAGGGRAYFCGPVS